MDELIILPNGVVAIFVDWQCTHDGDENACIVQHLKPSCSPPKSKDSCTLLMAINEKN
jgi:hypothetical protein